MIKFTFAYQKTNKAIDMSTGKRRRFMKNFATKTEKNHPLSSSGSPDTKFSKKDWTSCSNYAMKLARFLDARFLR